MNSARSDRMRRINAIHFVGIGGAGMSGLAMVALKRGLAVTGSDSDLSGTHDLVSAGARVRQGDAAELRAIDAGDSIVFGQPLIEKSVVGGEQVKDAPILPQNTLEE